MLGYLNDFRLMMVVTLLTMPFVLILRPVHHTSSQAPQGTAIAPDRAREGKP